MNERIYHKEIMDKLTEIKINIEKQILELPNLCTVKQYEQITGEKFPDDGLVWHPEFSITSTLLGYVARGYAVVKNWTYNKNTFRLL